MDRVSYSGGSLTSFDHYRNALAGGDPRLALAAACCLIHDDWAYFAGLFAALRVQKKRRAAAAERRLDLDPGPDDPVELDTGLDHLPLPVTTEEEINGGDVIDEFVPLGPPAKRLAEQIADYSEHEKARPDRLKYRA